jgi:hypothetical protein
MYSIDGDRALTFLSSSTHRELPIKNTCTATSVVLRRLISVRQRLVFNQLFGCAQIPNLTKRREHTELKHLSKELDCQIVPEKCLFVDCITLVKATVLSSLIQY